MKSQSPLLARARKTTGRGQLPLPRRGRIRILLALVAVALAAYFGRRFWPSLVRSGKQPVEKAAEGGKTDSGGRNAAAPSKERALDISGGNISAEQLKLILAKHPPNLFSPNDTITEGRRRLVVHYSLDTALQDAGKRLLKRYHPKYGAIAALHPASGRVLSLVSYNHPDEEPIDRHLFCRSIFPAASVIKTVTAAGAIEKGRLRAESPLKRTGRNHTLYKFQLKKHLKNYNEISLRDAFAYSINPVFGRMGIYTLGAQSFAEYAQRFGFGSSVPFELANDVTTLYAEDSAFALAEAASGFNQKTLMSPIHGALIGAAVSRGGGMPVPTLVDSVVDLADGAVVYRSRPALWRIAMQRTTASELSELMEAVTRYGTARRSFGTYIKRSRRFRNIEYGGKTGSVDKDGMGRVDWFVGYARHQEDPLQRLAVAVVTVHGEYWTVHSSFVAAEVLRHYIRGIQKAQEKMEQEQAEKVTHR